MGQKLTIQMPSLHAGQIEVAHSDARYRIMSCGRRWGKSRLCVALAAEQLFLGNDCWWVVPDFKNHGRVSWDLFGDLLSPFIKRGIIKVKIADRVYVNLNGGSIAWKDTKEGDRKLRSAGLDFAIIDEAAFMGGNAWATGIRPALGEKQGRAIFASTPNREGDWYHEMFKRGRSNKPDDDAYQSWHFPTWSSPFFPEAEVEQAQKDMTSIEFRREFGAEFVSAKGARIKRDWLRWGNPPPLGTLTISMGVDLAISESKTADYTACSVLGRDRTTGALWVLDVQRKRVGFRGALEFIREMAENWNPSVVAIESVSYQKAVVEELMLQTSLPIRAMPPRGDKVARFAGLESRYEQNSKTPDGRFIVHAYDLSGAFEDELLSFPQSQHDDQVDALAYAYLSMSGQTDNPYTPRSRRKPAPTFRV